MQGLKVIREKAGGGISAKDYVPNDDTFRSVLNGFSSSIKVGHYRFLSHRF
jgi:hypothetical protein